MADVIVHFQTKPNNGGRKIRAVAGPGVLAVVTGREAKERFLKAFRDAGRPLKETFGIPKQVVLKEARRDLRTELEEGEQGPEEVWYWVPGELVCWKNDEEDV